MLWEERRVFTVSELSKVEQGAKVWFLFGSQGPWHTKCFYKGKKKGRSRSEFSEISWFPFDCFAAVAFLGNSPIQGKVWSSSESPISWSQQNMPFWEKAGLAHLFHNTRQVLGVARLGRLHVMIWEIFCKLPFFPGLATPDTKGLGENMFFHVFTCRGSTDSYKQWLGQGGLSILWKI